MPHPDRFADAQAVAIHHRPEQQKISDSMTTFLGRFKECVHFGVAEEILRSFVPVCQLEIFHFLPFAAWALPIPPSQFRVVIRPLAINSLQKALSGKSRACDRLGRCLYFYWQALAHV